MLHVESTRKRLRCNEARLNVRWRLFTRRCPNVNEPHYISQCQCYEDEGQLWNVSLSCSGGNSTTRRFEERWSFVGTMLPCSDCNVMMCDRPQVRGCCSVDQSRPTETEFGSVSYTHLTLPTNREV